MTKYVLPSVEGSDLGRLLYYYTLIDAAGCEPYVTTIIKPDSHVKLLKKLRAVAKGTFCVFLFFLFDDVLQNCKHLCLFCYITITDCSADCLKQINSVQGFINEKNFK